MASFSAARIFHIPAMNGGAFRRRASWAAGIGGATAAGAALLRSCSSKRSLPFACRSISNDTRKIRLLSCFFLQILFIVKKIFNFKRELMFNLVALLLFVESFRACK